MYLSSALASNNLRNPLPGEKMRLPLATKSPEEATTFSRWSEGATVIVSMSEYHPPYLTYRVRIQHIVILLPVHDGQPEDVTEVNGLAAGVIHPPIIKHVLQGSIVH